jgi:hypothetical protein
MTPEHPRAKFYLSRRFIWYITWCLFANLFILQLMTLVYPKAKLYSSRPFIWHVTQYHLGNFFILHSMTPVYPWAELYSSRPLIWYFTWYPSSHFLFALNDPGTSYSSRTSICHMLLNTGRWNSIPCSYWSKVWWRFNPFSIYKKPPTEVLGNNGGHFENGSHLETFKGH